MEAGDNVTPSSPVVLAITAWGLAYADKLLRITLPALLADGNYPALAKEFDCELVILTEEALFRVFKDSKIIREFSRYGRVTFVPIDDLLIGSASYGLTLTLALFRAVAARGAKMMDTWFLFLNADFILANDSYRSMIPLLKRNVRGVICAPTYCAIEENVIDELKRREAGGAIAIDKREMAKLILANLHPTVSGQQIDAPYHFDSVYLYQGYVRPTPDLLFGYQMPISIVALRPTVHIERMTTFWDWGGVSELAPGGSEIVLGDSDDFLMLELRSRLTAADLLRLGPPTPAYIAEKLRHSLTRDQIHFGQFPLTLHSCDLPANVEDLRRPLVEYRQKIVDLLDKNPVEHSNHPNWRAHERHYEEKEAILKGAYVGEDARAKFIAASGNSLSTALISKYYDSLTKITQRAAERFHQRIEREFTDLVENYFFGDVEPDPESYVLFTERYRNLVLRHHQEWITYQHKFAYVPSVIGAPQANLQYYERLVFREVEQQGHREPPQSLPVTRLDESTADHAARSIARRRRGLEALVFNGAQKLLGQPPHLSKFHPYYGAFPGITRLLDESVAVESKVLVVADTATSGVQRLLARNSAKIDKITVQAAAGTIVESKDKFDLCYCELNFAQLSSMGQIYNGIRGAIKPGGKVLAFAINEDAVEIPVANPQFILDTFAVTAPMKVYYSGTELSMLAIRQYRKFSQAILRAPFRAALALARSLRLNYMNNQAMDSGPSIAPPRYCASITLEIDVPNGPQTVP